jgi:hypothetical protein
VTQSLQRRNSPRPPSPSQQTSWLVALFVGIAVIVTGSLLFSRSSDLTFSALLGLAATVCAIFARIEWVRATRSFSTNIVFFERPESEYDATHSDSQTFENSADVVGETRDVSTNRTPPSPESKSVSHGQNITALEYAISKNLGNILRPKLFTSAADFEKRKRQFIVISTKTSPATTGAQFYFVDQYGQISPVEADTGFHVSPLFHSHDDLDLTRQSQPTSFETD